MASAEGSAAAGPDKPSDVVLFWRQLKLMLWKNWLIKKHRPISLACEVFFPLVVSLLLIPAWQLTDIATGEIAAQSVSVLATPNGLLSSEYIPTTYVLFVCDGCSNDAERRFRESINSTLNGTFVDGNVIDTIPDAFPDGFIPPNTVYVESVEDEDAMVDAFRDISNEYDALSSNDRCFRYGDIGEGDEEPNTPREELVCEAQGGSLGVIISRSGNEWTYKIRTPRDSFQPSLSDFILNDPPLEYSISRRFETDLGLPSDALVAFFSGDNANWARSEFYKMQTSAEVFILRETTGDDTITMPEVALRNYPVGSYSFSFFASLIMPFMFAPIVIVSWLYAFVRAVGEVVTEKEARLKEGMRIMGLSAASFWLSWIITFYVIFFIGALGGFLVGAFTFFAAGDIGAAFVLYLLFPMAMTAVACTITTFFNKNSRVSLYVVVINIGCGVTWFLIQSNDVGASARLAASLWPGNAFVLGVIDITAQGGTPFPASWAIGMLVLDIFMYGILAYYFDAVLPKEFGVRRHPLFFLEPLWKLCARGGKGGFTAVGDNSAEPLEMHVPLNKQEDNENFQRPPKDDSEAKSSGVRAEHLFKSFGSVHAVNDLTLSMFNGQVFGLLGHNGAGKTTTINMLTGLYTPSSGEAWIDGMSITKEMHNIRKSMGVCPQFDVLWPKLTVREHLQVFARMKEIPRDQVDARVESLVKQVGLLPKINTQSSNLSGGQKRKLSFAIAMIGDPKVLFLDEPTAGMDPESRRDIWNLIQHFKENRVIVLTTHLMDEADLLSDRIGVMSFGELLTCGSPTFLKSKFGHGFTLTISKSHDGVGLDNQILKCIKQHTPDVRVLSKAGTELQVQLAFNDSSKFPDLFDELDNRRDEFHISNYGISETTLEDVFLTILSRHAHDDETREKNKEAAASSAPERKDFVTVDLDEQEVKKSAQDDDSYDVMNGDTSPLTFSGNELSENHSTFFDHIFAMWKKRFDWAKRDISLLVCQMIIPIVILIAVLAAVQLDASANPSVEINNIYGLSGNTRILLQGNELVDNFGLQPSLWPVDNVDYAPAQNLDDASRNADLEANLLRHGAIRLEINETPGGEGEDLLTFVLNIRAPHALPVLTNEFNTARLRSLSGANDANINFVFQEFPPSAAEIEANDLTQGIVTVLILIVVNAFAPASAVYFIVNEKQVGAKHQQVVSGVYIAAYWFSNYVWDVMLTLIPTAVTLGVIAGFEVELFIETEFGSLGASILLLILTPMAYVSFVYAISFMCSNPSKSQILTVLFLICAPPIGVIILLLTYVAFIASGLTGGGDLADAQGSFTIAATILSFIPPNAYAIGGGSLFIASTFGWNSTVGEDAYDAIGTYLGILAADTVIYLLVVVFIEWNRTRKRAPHQTPDLAEAVDPDVAAEKQRLMNDSDDVIQLHGLRKTYKTKTGPHTAVKEMWYGVPTGQCFGFLGVNGAGKTSTLKMLTGEVPPDSGDAFLGGHSIVTDINECRRLVGNCPQFDPILVRLTPREHLQLFAKIKGIAKKDMEKLVNEMIEALQLGKYADRQAGTLSGGNKRKLSVAMSLIGSPGIVFLDEPSTGLDPRARRFMWNFINKTMANRAVVLTTHSMEECEALCSRIGIMVAGNLKCIGTAQHLKNKFAQGHELTITLAGGDSVDQQQVDQLSARVASVFANPQRIEVQGSHVKFRVPPQQMRLSDMFRTIEKLKGDLGFENYSLSQTTLEQVFLHHARNTVAAAAPAQPTVIYVDANGNQVQPQAITQAPNAAPSASPPSYIEPDPTAVEMDKVNGATPTDEPSAPVV